MEAVANLPDKVQITPMVMDRRRVITSRPKAPAKTTERVEAEVAMVAATAAVIAVTRTIGLCTPATA